MTDAVFLDRDGVINQLVFNPDLGLVDSPLNPAEFKLISGAAEAIKTFNRLGLKVIVVSNQPGIAKGKMSEENFDGIREKMKSLLAKNNAHIDGEYYCLHHPEAQRVEFKVKCRCRKPQPGLLLKAAKELGLKTSKSYMIGDGVTDIKAGQAVGCKSILIGAVKCDLCKLMETMAVKPDVITSSLLNASKIIEKEMTETKEIFVDTSNNKEIEEKSGEKVRQEFV
jgi:D-glycero-D-manno-heptose 1,7-bisphosphate phosphatase